MNAPEFEGVQNWNAGDYCLRHVRVEEWGPFVFANMDSGAPSFPEVLGNIPADIREANIDIAQMVN